MANGCSGEVMQRESLSTVSHQELMARLRELVREERQVTASVLEHLAEVEARKLYLPAACSSMHGYCTRVLGMSDDEAFKRIRAARVMRRHPVVATAVADGRLHLTGVVLLAPHLTDENAAGLVAEASGKSKAEIDVLLARRAPRPDVAARLERVAEQLALAPELQNHLVTKNGRRRSRRWRRSGSGSSSRSARRHRRSSCGRRR